MKIMGCYVQGQGHTEGSKFQLVFAHTNICKIVEPYVTKRGIVMQHCDQSVTRIDCFWFAVTKVKVTVRLTQLEYGCFYNHFWTMTPFATSHSLMVHHLKLGYCGKIGLPCLRSRPQSRFKPFLNVCRSCLICTTNLHPKLGALMDFCQSCIFCTADLFATKLGVLMVSS